MSEHGTPFSWRCFLEVIAFQPTENIYSYQMVFTSYQLSRGDWFLRPKRTRLIHESDCSIWSKLPTFSEKASLSSITSVSAMTSTTFMINRSQLTQYIAGKLFVTLKWSKLKPQIATRDLNITPHTTTVSWNKHTLHLQKHPILPYNSLSDYTVS